MPLTKILFKPGVNRENTRYTTEGGWYEGDKIRFRQGTPESIGGWQRISGYTYQGICRSLWNWVTLGGLNLVGVGTNLKFYIERGGAYNDITPIRATATLGTDPFTANGTTTVTVTAASHGCVTGDFVTFSGATGTYASTLNAEFQVTVVNNSSYTIVTGSALAAGSYGGSAVVAAYQINVGPATSVPTIGWGSGTWGSGTWGFGTSTYSGMRLWSQTNYGEDLIFNPRGGGLYYWDATSGVNSRGVLLNSRGGTATITIASPAVVTSTVLYNEGAAIKFSTTGALPTGITAGTTYYVFNAEGLTFKLVDANGNVINTSGSQSGVQSITPVDIPTAVNSFTVSDTSRFILAMGCNDYGESTIDPMLIRWSAQNDPYNWTPDETNQARSVRLSRGSEIITSIQTRQEIVVFTDSAAYSLQYLGPPNVWGSQLLGDNLSIAGPNAVAVASGVVYWMGVDKFYAYDGRVQTLNCDLRRFVFNDFSKTQAQQTFCGTNEGFNEVWWFYCSAGSDTVDKYVVYNYAEQIWYYGTLARTAWLDSGLRDYPLAATYSHNLVDHENGINDNEGLVTAPINAYVSSSEFDIEDGHSFGFIWRVLPDMTFENSSNYDGAPPQVTMTLYGLYNSGSGAIDSAGQAVLKGATYTITEEFTGQIYTRVRGRQMIFKMSSNQINTAWQLGAPRIDIRPDGKR
jgi:hypothetical protein